MGLPLFSNSSYDRDTTVKTETKVEGNPVPTNFHITRFLPVGNYLIVLAVYPDAKNYEGRKIMVYEDVTIHQMNYFKSLDPHFSDTSKYKCPIARFEPTDRGWEMAMKFCLAM